MWKKLFCLAIALTLGAPVFAQESFYKGKTIRMIVGASAGGGYDTYTRTIARHMGKHIPGSPAFFVENMPGAGFLISANYMYNVAKPDGLTIGHFIGGLFLQQVLGKPGIEFDARRFEYIGVPGQDNYVVGLSKSGGITNMEQWMAAKTAPKLGGVGPGSGTDDIPKVLNTVLGLPLQLVTGYKGTADIRLAFNSGELQGVCNSWESFKSTWRKELETGQLVVVLQNTPRPHPDLPNVPQAMSFAKNEEQRQLIQVGAHDFGAAARPYVLSPKTPKDRVAMLRRAFRATMSDPEFLADAAKARLDINPLNGDELQEIVMRLFKLKPPVVAKLKKILK